MNNPDVIIYTDGSSRGNPGPGGYGIILKDCNSGYVKEYSKGFNLTTNNRMELLAVIDALKKLKKENLRIIIYTDSQYVINPIEKQWLVNWKKTNFKNKKNIDLWLEFLIEQEKHKLQFRWIKGHNDHPQNERCDKLAVDASKKKNLFEDKGYNINILL